MTEQRRVTVPDPYPDIVAKSFLDNAVRSALLIDDQFPMFNTPTEDVGRYVQADRAKHLYQMCKARDILCDIESRSSVFSELNKADLLNKSDLVILDFNLDGDQSPPTKSLNILRKLSETPHFNVVALYTASSDLRDVWIKSAAALKGGWAEPDAILSPEQLKSWEDIEDDDKLPSPELELVVSWLAEGPKRALRTEAGKRLHNSFLALGIHSKECTKFVEARVTREIKTILGVHGFDEETEINLFGSCQDGLPLWIQHGNLFVAVLKKETPQEGCENSNDPEKIWARLVDAIKAWRPNLLQVVLSEIQNILELGGITIDESYTGSPARQAGILYSLFSDLPEGKFDGDLENLRPHLEGLIWKLVESLRRKISTDENLLQSAVSLLNFEINKEAWERISPERKQRTNQVLQFIRTEVMAYAMIEPNDVFFELNAFVSADKFRGSHLTTGTIFRTSDSTEWLLCSSPACDMVPREPNISEWERKPWNNENYPYKKMLALRLEPVTPAEKDLSKATHNRRIYIYGTNGERLQFQVLNEYNHPSWEMLLLEDAGRVCVCGDGTQKLTFKAKQLELVTPEGEACTERVQNCSLKSVEFEVVSQLRPEYANRILQFTGHHLSRIGVDFFSA